MRDDLINYLMKITTGLVSVEYSSLLDKTGLVGITLHVPGKQHDGSDATSQHGHKAHNINKTNTKR